MTKFQIYLLASIAAAIGVIGRAFVARPNFWSATILLASSNGSLIVLTNVALILTGGFVYALQRLLYGPLRPIEVEQLYERGWMAVTETLLSLTIFREDIGTRFFGMFLSLMAGKIWCWIGEGRVEFLEQQPPANPILFHSRLAGSLVLSVFFDTFMLGWCLQTILRQARPGMMVMYGFEYTILSIQSVTLLMRYCINVAQIAIVKQQTAQRIEARRAEIRAERAAARATAIAAGEEVPPEAQADELIEVDEHEIDVPGWEEKGRWIFYLDLVSDFIKSVVYCGFFVILLVFHGLPIHIMRDLYITVRSFCKRVMDFVQYRAATKNMNERYADATVEDLQSDNTCIICREEMTAWAPQQGEGRAPRAADERQRAKKLPCGHILHFNCLRSWLERQRVCPTCRRPVLEGTGTATQPPANGRDAQGRFQQNVNRQPAPGAANQVANQLHRHGLGVPLPPANQNQGQNANHNQNQQNQNQDQGQQRPGNMRVFNFGPLRIALGAGPLNQAGEILNNMARQQQNQQGNEQHNQQQHVANSNGHNIVQGADAAATASEQIRHQVIQLSGQVGQMIQRLQAEHRQLDVLNRVVGELVRIQTGQTGMQQPQLEEYSAGEGGQPMAGQDPNLPAGMILPPGYTLQRLYPVQQPPQVPTLQIPSTSIRTDGQVLPSPSVQNQENSSMSTSAPSQPTNPSTSLPTTSSLEAQDRDSEPPAAARGSTWAFKDNAPQPAATATSSSSQVGEHGESASTARQRAPLPASVEDAEAEPTNS